MTIKTFWIIFLKIAGIIFLVRGIAMTLDFALNTFMIYGEVGADGFYGMIMFVVTLFLYIFIPLLMLFKTSWVVETLHLERGFAENKIELNAKRSSIISVAVIIIGGYLVIESLPQLFIQIFGYINTTSIYRAEFESIWILFHAIKLILGYLIMTNSKSIVLFIEKQKPYNNEVE